MFDVNGNKIGNEAHLNSTPSSHQQIASLNNGGFVISWLSGDRNIAFQAFDAEGHKVGSEVLVYGYHTNTDKPSIAVLSNGNFVVGWNGYDVDSYGIQVQIFDSNGNALSQKINANTYTAGGQYNQKVVALHDGGFVVSWIGAGYVRHYERDLYYTKI